MGGREDGREEGPVGAHRPARVPVVDVERADAEHGGDAGGGRARGGGAVRRGNGVDVLVAVLAAARHAGRDRP